MNEKYGNLLTGFGYPGRLPEGPYKKGTFLFYRSGYSVEEGLIGTALFLAKKAGQAEIKFLHGIVGEFSVEGDFLKGASFPIYENIQIQAIPPKDGK
jgi:hypothetical protein